MGGSYHAADTRTYMENRRKICALMTVMLLSVWLYGCGESSAEALADSVSGNDAAAVTVTDEVSGDNIGEYDAVPPEGAVSENAGEPPAIADLSGNSMADDVSANAVLSTADIATRPAPVKVRGIYVSGPTAGTAKMDELIELVAQTELNAMVIDVKNDEGKITYKMQTDQVVELEAGVRYIPDIGELVRKCKAQDIYLIARIVAFRDPYLAQQKPEWAVHTKDGALFRDRQGLAWVNPYNREMWDYLVEIAAQAAADGFDEVQFDYIRFSTDIGEEEVDYGPEAARAGKVEIITEFTEYMYERLSVLGVYVAADVFGTVIDNETDQQIVGQDYAQMAAHLDYICPMVYPSHYRNGAYGIKVPDAEPYATIYAAAASSAEQLAAVPEEKRAHVRMWLQSFTAGWVSGHISYGPQQIREQIKGAYDAGYEEWILWNAAVNYQPEAFLTEEEAAEEQKRWDAEVHDGTVATGQEPAGTEAEAAMRNPAGTEVEAAVQNPAGTEAENAAEPEAQNPEAATQNPAGTEPETQAPAAVTLEALDPAGAEAEQLE